MGYFKHYSKWHNHHDPVYVQYMKRKFRKALQEHLPQSKESAILEIGCANGMALSSLKEMGYTDLLGIELDEELASIARELELEILNQDAIIFLKTTKKRFDFIYLFDVLEHFQPSLIPEFLTDLYNVLNENGKLVLIVPNATSPAGSYFRYIDWTHQVSFTPTSIMYLLEESGFTSISISDESLIEKPDRKDFGNEESYQFAKKQSDSARFYESFARWEMTSMFGSSPYNLLIAPNMKVVACKNHSLKSADLKINTDTQEIFDLEAWTQEMDAARLKLTQSAEQYQEDIEGFRESERLLNEKFNNLSVELNTQAESVQFLKKEIQEIINQANEIKQFAKLQQFANMRMKSRLEKIQLDMENVSSDNLEVKMMLLSVYKQLMLMERNKIWWKIKFKFKVNEQKRMIEKSGLFDKEYYLEQNPDVKEAGMDPIVHYLSHGAFEGRNPSSKFNTDEYILKNPDLILNEINPLIHLIGWRDN